MEYKLFKTREEAEVAVAQAQKQSEGRRGRFGVEERYLVKSQIAFPDAPVEYLMEDNSFKKTTA